MMIVDIKPSKAKGVAAAPPSKSMAHRMLICAGLAKGESKVNGLAESQDILATSDCLRALGIEVEKVPYPGGNEIIGRKHISSAMVRGRIFEREAESTVLNCRESGSTIRFFIPICLLLNKEVVLKGSRTLLTRPLSIYEEICEKSGFVFEKGEEQVKVRGRLKPGTYEMNGNISSQFVSGLLFALPLLEDESIIKLKPPVTSRPYIDITIQAQREFGVKCEWISETEIRIPGKQSYQSGEVEVEGDYSNAAFLEALNIAGGNVEVTGLSSGTLQGDRVYKECFETMKKGAADIDINNCPDLGPILFAAAGILDGCTFRGTKRLRIKESDRVLAMKQELKKFGIIVNDSDDSVVIENTKLNVPNEILDGHNDHRIVMSMAVLSVITGGTISGAEAVRKSYPDFFEVLIELGVDLEIRDQQNRGNNEIN